MCWWGRQLSKLCRIQRWCVFPCQNCVFPWCIFTARSSHQRCSVKKGVLRNFPKFIGKHLCQSLFFNKVAGGACNFNKKETLAQVFSCEFSEISKNTFFTEHLWVTASLLYPLLFIKSMTYSLNIHFFSTTT